MRAADFEEAAREHAKELAQTAFGELLTHTIGRIYVFKASQALKLNDFRAHFQHCCASKWASLDGYHRSDTDPLVGFVVFSK